MRFVTAALLAGLAGTALGPAADAQTAPQTSATNTDAYAQRYVRRAPTRLRVHPLYESGADGVYPRYYPGRNAVRECTANYVLEYRPSGTVIVPRMNCFWRPG